MIKEYVVKNTVGLYKAIKDLENYSENYAIPDDGLVLTLSEYAPSRSSQQRKLMWIRNGEIAKQWDGERDNKYIHALSKREILLPFMLGIERHHAASSLIKDAIDRAPTEKAKLMIAYRMIRSSDLSIQEFNDYLDMMVVYWGMNADIQFTQ